MCVCVCVRVRACVRICVPEVLERPKGKNFCDHRYMHNFQTQFAVLGLIVITPIVRTKNKLLKLSLNLIILYFTLNSQCVLFKIIVHNLLQKR